MTAAPACRGRGLGGHAFWATAICSLIALLLLSSVSAASPRWSKPVEFGTDATGHARVPEVALGPGGAGVIVYLFRQPLICPTGAQCVVSVRAITRGSSSKPWSDPVTLSDSNGSLPQVAMDASGQATVVYSEGPQDGPYAVRAVTWRPSSGWSDPVTISTSPAYPYALLAENRRGDAIVLWGAAGPGGDLQVASRLGSTSAWEAAAPPKDACRVGDGSRRPW